MVIRPDHIGPHAVNGQYFLLCEHSIQYSSEIDDHINRLMSHSHLLTTDADVLDHLEKNRSIFLSERDRAEAISILGKKLK